MIRETLMNPPSTSIFARSAQPSIPDYSLSSYDAARKQPPAAPAEAGPFAKKPYSPPQIELLED